MYDYLINTMPSITSVEGFEKIVYEINSELNDVNIEPVINLDKKNKR